LPAIVFRTFAKTCFCVAIRRETTHNRPGDPRLAGFDENSDGTKYEARNTERVCVTNLEIVSTEGVRNSIIKINSMATGSGGAITS